jgi:2'-5' RNA ligase
MSVRQALGSAASGARTAVARLHRVLLRGRAGDPERWEVAVALLLDGATDAYNHVTALQLAIRRRAGVNEGLSAPPHISLKLGFGATDLDGLARLLDEVAARTEAPEIALGNVASFRDEGILFLDVVKTPELDRLRRDIVGQLAERFQVRPNRYEGDVFHLHVTLAYGLPRREFERECALLAPEAAPFRFRARSLALLCWTGTHWMTVRRATLRDQAPATEGVGAR